MRKKINVCIIALCVLGSSLLIVTEVNASVSVFVYGYITDSVTGLPVPQAKVTVIMPGGGGVVYTSATGYYSKSISSNEPGPLTVQVKAEKYAYYTQTKSFSTYSGSYRKDFSLVDRGERIAVFFYDDDSTTDEQIEDYSTYMANRGYQTIIYRQPTDWVARMNYIDSIESTYDRVLIYVGGHGNYYWIDDVSKVTLKKWWIFSWVMYSDDFRAEVVDLESQRITVVVRSCYSGDFKDELASVSGVTVLSSCTESERSDSAFSQTFFWEFAVMGNSITETYAEVCDMTTYHPQIDYGAQSYTYV
ncbi:MAG: hypothetical protein ACFFDT_13465 [Candidatus Hodarchaeota archaeon]